MMVLIAALGTVKTSKMATQCSNQVEHVNASRNALAVTVSKKCMVKTFTQLLVQEVMFQIAHTVVIINRLDVAQNVRVEFFQNGKHGNQETQRHTLIALRAMVDRLRRVHVAWRPQQRRQHRQMDMDGK